MRIVKRLDQLQETLLPTHPGRDIVETIIFAFLERPTLLGTEEEKVDMFLRVFQYAGFIPDYHESSARLSSGESIRDLIDRSKLREFMDFFSK